MSKKGLITRFITSTFSKKPEEDIYISLHLVTTDIVLGKFVSVNGKSTSICHPVVVKFGVNEDNASAYMYFVNYNQLSMKENLVVAFENTNIVSASEVDFEVIGNYIDFTSKDKKMKDDIKKIKEEAEPPEAVPQSLKDEITQKALASVVSKAFRDFKVTIH
jgi:hypothetical protein